MIDAMPLRNQTFDESAEQRREFDITATTLPKTS